MSVSVPLNGESDCSEVGAADFELRARGGQHRFLDGVHQHVEDPCFLEGIKRIIQKGEIDYITKTEAKNLDFFMKNA